MLSFVHVGTERKHLSVFSTSLSCKRTIIHDHLNNSHLYCTYSYLCFCYIYFPHESHEQRWALAYDAYNKSCLQNRSLFTCELSYMHSPGWDEIALIYGTHPPFRGTGTLNFSVPVWGAVEQGGLQTPTRVNTIHCLI